MPAELPGLYWDETKNRYFSLSSKPQLQKPQPARPLQSASSIPSIPSRKLKRKRRDVPWNASESLRGTCFRHKRAQSTHEIMCSRFASTSHLDHSRIPVFGSLTAFCTTSINGQVRSFIGDDRGWLYSYIAEEDVPISDSETERWAAELNLQASSEISSICISGSRCVATSFGSSAKMAVVDLSTPERTTTIFNLNGVHDVWTSHLQGRTLVVGANKKAVYLRDIDFTPPMRVLDTQSDVFALHQQENLVYTGARNGSIARFDMRMGKPQGQKLFGGRFKNERSSVLHLNIIREWQILVSHMDGHLGTFDLRFLRESIPLLNFPGHVNTLTRNLGIAVDPSEDFLFAAGEDRRIRGWSLQTGKPLQPPLLTTKLNLSSQISYKSNPFQTPFLVPITTLQVTEGGEGLCLWAAGGSLYKYYLGQQTPGLIE